MICFVRRSDVSKKLLQPPPQNPPTMAPSRKSIHVGARIELTGFDELEELIKHEFTYANPAFHKLAAMNVRAARGIPKELHTWVGGKGKPLTLPRGALSRLLALLDKQPPNADERRWFSEATTCARFGGEPDSPPENWARSFASRPNQVQSGWLVAELSLLRTMKQDLFAHQERVVQALLTHRCGIGRSPTGSGKTTAGLACASALGVRTLVLVHTKNLVDEWCRRALSELGVTANRDVRKAHQSPLSVLTVQTFTKHAKDHARSFGLVIGDEVHKFAAPTFYSAVDCLEATYKLGLSADERRGDGLHFLTKDLFGPVIVDIPEEEVLETGNTIEVELRVIPFETKCPDWLLEARQAMTRVAKTKAVGGKPLKSDVILSQGVLQSYDRILQLLSADVGRFTVLCHLIHEELDSGARVCVLTHRRETAQGYMKALQHRKPASVLGGDASRGVEAMLRGDTRLIVGTFEAVGTGTNLPMLNVGVFVDPCHQNKQNLKQYMGRFCRNDGSGATPRVYVPWDEGIYGDDPLRRYVAMYPKCLVRSEASEEYDEWEPGKIVLRGSR